MLFALRCPLSVLAAALVWIGISWGVLEIAELDLRIRDSFYSVVAAIYNKLDVACSQSVEALRHVRNRYSRICFRRVPRELRQEWERLVRSLNHLHTVLLRYSWLDISEI